MVEYIRLRTIAHLRKLQSKLYVVAFSPFSITSTNIIFKPIFYNHLYRSAVSIKHLTIVRLQFLRILRRSKHPDFSNSWTVGLINRAIHFT